MEELNVENIFILAIFLIVVGVQHSIEDDR